MDKQTECQKIRERMGELVEKRTEALSKNKNPRVFTKEFNELSCRLFRLERAMKKGSAQ
ncbi:hypothetical protein [Paenibacillus sp. NRS-1780]|uniref:hypothetical protein n=1 Tax=Paenibacillus sp. NRS-1780 TaxID=3233904 RepID=UPI003D2E7F7F